MSVFKAQRFKQIQQSQTEKQVSHGVLSPNAGLLHHDSCCTCGAGDRSNCGFCCTRIEHLSVRSGSVQILEDVNLHIHCGELTAIVGRNGAGKTTFLRALLGEIPHQGSIYFSKTSIKEKTALPRFGYVPQKLHIAEGSPVSVADLVQSSLSRRPVWLRLRKKDVKRIETVLAVTETVHLMARRLCDLSGGELQRVMLALALNPLPDILLLDEPVAGVDRRGLISFYELVSSLRKKNDITILLISHDLDLVARHADRVVLFDGGKALEGTPRSIFKTKEFTDAFGYYNEDSQ